MKLPTPFAAKPRTAEQCRAEIARLEAEHAAAVEQLASMIAERVELLAGNGAIEELLAFDAQQAQTRLRVERIAVQLTRLGEELQQAQQREEIARRQASFDKGAKPSATVRG